MDVDLIGKLWPYIERAGSVAAVILCAWLYLTLQENKRLRTKNDEIQEQRIKDALTITTLVEKNTAATNAQSELIRMLISNHRGAQ